MRKDIMDNLLTYKFRKKNLKQLKFLHKYFINPFWDIIDFLCNIKGLGWLNDALIQDFYYRNGYGSIKAYWCNSIFIYNLSYKLKHIIRFLQDKFLNPIYQEKIFNWFIGYSDSKLLTGEPLFAEVRNREQDTKYFCLYVIPYLNYFTLKMNRYVDKNGNGINMFIHSFLYTLDETDEDFKNSFTQETTTLFKGFILNRSQFKKFVKSYKDNYERKIIC